MINSQLERTHFACLSVIHSFVEFQKKEIMNSQTNDEHLDALFEQIKTHTFIDFSDSDDDDYGDVVDVKVKSQDKLNEYVFVDVQGFKGSHNRFICKEFCLVDESGIFHEIIQSPFPVTRLSTHLRKQVKWVTQNYHGLSYEDGDMHIIELTEKMSPKMLNKKILVKGDEKIKWLEYMFRFCGNISCLNVEDMNISYNCRENDLYDSCEFHRWIREGSLPVCARYNALLLQDLAKKNVNALY